MLLAIIVKLPAQIILFYPCKMVILQDLDSGVDQNIHTFFKRNGSGEKVRVDEFEELGP